MERYPNNLLHFIHIGFLKTYLLSKFCLSYYSLVNSFVPQYFIYCEIFLIQKYISGMCRGNESEKNLAQNDLPNMNDVDSLSNKHEVETRPLLATSAKLLLKNMYQMSGPWNLHSYPTSQDLFDYPIIYDSLLKEKLRLWPDLPSCNSIL